MQEVIVSCIEGYASHWTRLTVTAQGSISGANYVTNSDNSTESSEFLTTAETSLCLKQMVSATKCVANTKTVLGMGRAEAEKKSFILLFRHLLRAASYLPDEFARSYIHDFIIHRFRSGSNLTPAKNRLRKASKALRILQRAGDGELNPLNKVLFQTYGRSGKRRRVLVTKLLQAETGNTAYAGNIPKNGATPEHIVAKDTNPDGSWKSARPLLDKLIRSQAEHHPTGGSRKPIREFKPKFPKSIWDKPVALRRQRSIACKFWADLLDRILPPVPSAEWLRLKDLVRGDIPFKGPPPRRIRARSFDAEELPAPRSRLDTPYLTAPYLTKPIRHVARPEKEAQLREREKHAITARFMRRRWATVWNQCPMLSYNGESREWTVVWGGSRSTISQGIVAPAAGRELELFEDMAEGGGAGPARRAVGEANRPDEAPETSTKAKDSTNAEESKTLRL